jgi:hypothetical protein
MYIFLAGIFGVKEIPGTCFEPIIFLGFEGIVPVLHNQGKKGHLAQPPLLQELLSA